MIHTYRNNRWEPGPDHREGSQSFPAHTRVDTWFNDVTGAVGGREAEVVEGLPQMLMKQGALSQWLPSPFDWHGLMERMRPYHESQGLSTLDVADIVVRPDETLDIRPGEGWDASVVTDASTLAHALVRANGQMDFIRRQPWFAAGTHEVVLKLLTKSGSNLSELRFHKDSEGEELFGNLVFRNDQPMPATEWSVDLEDMPDEKAALLEENWPSSLIDEIDAARGGLRLTTGRVFQIEGGTLPPDGCISWVDELVWHSIPVLANRPRHTLDEVLAILANPEYTFATYEVLVQIAQTWGGRFATRLADDGVPIEELSEEALAHFWAASLQNPDVAYLREDWLADARSIDWAARPRDTAIGVSLIQHDNATEEINVLQQPTGMVGRPRSNSLNLRELLALPGRQQFRHLLAVLVSVRPAQ